MARRFSTGPIREPEIERILEIEASSFGKEAYDRKLFAEYLHKCGDLFLGAREGRKLCGYMLTHMRADTGRAELVSVAVDPEYRGMGVASTLMESTLRRLRRRGATRFTLMVKLTNRKARRFYEKYGFSPVRRVPGYYEDGKEGLLMRKVLRD